MRISTGMCLAGRGTDCMTPEPKQKGHYCNLRNQTGDSDLHSCIDKIKLSSESNRRQTSVSFEDNSYSVNSFHLHSTDNGWLGFWLFLVSSSYFLLTKNVNLFCGLTVRHAEEVSLSDRTISNASTENDATATNDKFNSSESENSESSHRTSFNNSLTELCTKFSDLDKASYLHSLLSLEDEDSEWLSDSMPYECSSENLSTPLSYKCDSFSEVSDVDTPTYWDSFFSPKVEDSEWISDSKQKLECVFWDDFLSSSYKENWDIEVPSSVSSVSSEDNISMEHLLETTDIEEFSADEPLFWPFEGEFDWNSEEPWSSFCTSPRRRFVFDSRSATTRIKGCEQKGDEALFSVNSKTSRLNMWSKSSAKIVPLESVDEKVALKRGEVLSNCTFLDEDFRSNKHLPLGKECFALDQELPIEILVGLEEFDGHEGLDSEFNDDVFMLDEYPQCLSI
ncbi:hypothetical protein VNO77_29125 [Canavalia gladiata]|uniref:Uncharacterized protein n=1 Tax=Canavalia gladiata TaxID=3824 RepID=A0AAN9Q7M6_CANGL